MALKLSASVDVRRYLTLCVLQLSNLLLQPLELCSQLFLPLAGPLSLVPGPFQLGLQPLQLQV